MINDILEQLDSSLKDNYSDVFESLQPGASEEELKTLKEKCFEGKDLPEDLVSLYKWHNGQTGFDSLNQNDNRTFLPILEVIDTWEFLNDPMEDILEPISRSWIPITHNGAGDYLVYETEGENAGKIIEYWHDDEGRDVEYDGIKAWITAALEVSKS